AELTLLCKLCLLRRSLSMEQLMQLFLCAPAVQARTLWGLAEMFLHAGMSAEASEQLREVTDAMRAIVEEALHAAPLAGPEESFRGEVRQALEKAQEVHGEEVDLQLIAQLMGRLYADTKLDIPSEELPLSASDRKELRYWCGRYVKLRDDPFMPLKENLKVAV